MPRRGNNIANFQSLTITFHSQRLECPAVRPRLRLKMWRRPGFDSQHQVKNKLWFFGGTPADKHDNIGMQHAACFMQIATGKPFAQNFEHPAYCIYFLNWQKHVVNVARSMVTYILRRFLRFFCLLAILHQFCVFLHSDHTVKKRFESFPSPAGMSLPKSPCTGTVTS